MKTNLLLICAVLTFGLAGCATVQPGSQSAEVQAERSLIVSLAAIDGFLRFESAHRSELPPTVAAIGSAVRRDAPKALQSSNTTRMAYKANRSGGEASLWTALAVVDSLVGQVRVWLPPTTASAAGQRRHHALELESEARSHGGKTTGSFIVLVPLFVDLAKEVFKAVNESRAAAAQSAEWTPEQDASFAANLTATVALPHWQ